MLVAELIADIPSLVPRPSTYPTVPHLKGEEIFVDFTSSYLWLII